MQSVWFFPFFGIQTFSVSLVDLLLLEPLAPLRLGISTDMVRKGSFGRPLSLGLLSHIILSSTVASQWSKVHAFPFDPRYLFSRVV